MSTRTSVVLLTNMLTAPPAPAGTIAALAFVRPSVEFRVETVGWSSPVGQIVKYPKCCPAGTTVTFNEYAAAPEGMVAPQVPSWGSGKLRDVPPSIGPPPPCCLVSTKRHGLSGTNCNAAALAPATTDAESLPSL